MKVTMTMAMDDTKGNEAEYACNLSCDGALDLLGRVCEDDLCGVVVLLKPTEEMERILRDVLKNDCGEKNKTAMAMTVPIPKLVRVERKRRRVNGGRAGETARG